MCGIFFSVAPGAPIHPGDQTKAQLIARGPDSYKSFSVTISGHISVTLVASVLALRGDHVEEQPMHHADFVLCWNGEAWKVNEDTVHGNDSTRVFVLLQQASNASGVDHQQAIVHTLQAIAGPFAFTYLDGPNSTIFYGRDRLGRRSLLVDRSRENSLTVCSVPVESVDTQMIEVDPAAIHFVDMKGKQLIFGQVPWSDAQPSINNMLPSHPLHPTPSPGGVENFLKHLTNALTLRVVDIPTHSQTQQHQNSAKVAILFSGGLDCTLLARLVHDILPRDERVDLLNVAFENPRSLAAGAKIAAMGYELCPDRVTGRSSFSELCQVCPDRHWRFVAINVPYTESQAHTPTIRQLMRPHNTEMDLSIAMALYFAARGVGCISGNPSNPLSHTTLFTSHARVLLSGFGADELYGGYSRHAAAFARGDFAALTDELKLDFMRIGSRNLGRDDRVMSHWGKEVRYPYLDEDLVKFSLDLPVWEKCGFRIGQKFPKHYEEVDRANQPGKLEPAKMLLRLATWKLGMPRVASERKRAIQFGARTAKMDIGKGRTKGTDVLVTTT